MAFRKRNVGLSQPSGSDHQSIASRDETPLASIPGTRPSPVDGRLTTSTGTPSLDGLLAGHSGLALGHSVLIEENETTDSAGALLKYYAAEGLVQGHRVHAVGVPPTWTRELPGVIGAGDERGRGESEREKEKMKIAWRYEKLGDFESTRGVATAGSRGACTSALRLCRLDDPNSPLPSFRRFVIANEDYRPAPSIEAQSGSQVPEQLSVQPFCHTFDLAKRLELPPGAKVEVVQLSSNLRESPFTTVLAQLTGALSTSPPTTIHRLVMPTILSPAVYTPQASQPQHLLQFLHSLRSLLRQYPTKFTAMLSLPLELYPRSTSLVRWAEILCDGIIELTPFPHRADEEATLGAATREEERPQGMVKVHKMPIFHERGGGGAGAGKLMGEDLAYVVSRRKFLIKPFALGPAGGDRDAQKEAGAEGSMPSKDKLDF